MFRISVWENGILNDGIADSQHYYRVAEDSERMLLEIKYFVHGMLAFSVEFIGD